MLIMHRLIKSLFNISKAYYDYVDYREIISTTCKAWDKAKVIEGGCWGIQAEVELWNWSSKYFEIGSKFTCKLNISPLDILLRFNGC